MKILVVTQYFWPENFRINDLVLDLNNKGHSVTVLTGMPNYPAGSFYKGYGMLSKSKDVFNGISVRRVPIVSRGQSKGIRLVLNYLSFAFFGSLLGPLYCRDKYDLIFVFEPSPITVCIPAIVIKKLRGTPILLWILDLWPESLSATKGVSSQVLLSAVGRFVRYVYSQCDRILVSSKGFISNVLDMGVPQKKILYFPNWTEDVYWKAPAKTKVGGLPEGFRVLFAGNIGAAQSFPTILDAASILREDSGIHWLIAGDGRMSEWVAGQIRARRLENCVHMLGSYSPEEVLGLFYASDALLVTLARNHAFSLTVPGKIQSYLASKKPIIASLDGEGSRLIEESGAGVSCPAEDPKALSSAVLTLRGKPVAERMEMGEKGRKYCEENFDRAKLLTKLEGWLQDFIKEYNR